MKPAVILVLLFTLAGCGAQETLKKQTARVIRLTKSSCKFLPDATAVMSLLSVPGGGMADQVAGRICRRVNAMKNIRPTSTGDRIAVVVDGQRVKGEILE